MSTRQNGHPQTVSGLDVVIPVHSSLRPIRRAVSSVLASSNEEVRAVVVCHNIDPTLISEKLEGLDPSRFSLVPLQDGIPSPAGPLNAGVLASTADYVAFLGSDDEYELGSLETWLREAATQGNPEVLIGQLLSDSRGRVMAPLPRPRQPELLDPAKDLLNNRTAPVGAIIRRDFLTASGTPSFTANLKVGEDIELGLYLWNSAARIAYSSSSRGYLIHESGDDRVTGAPMSLHEALHPVERIASLSWVKALPHRNRNSIATKLLRYQIIDVVIRRGSTISESDLEAAANAARALLEFAPKAQGRLSHRESQILDGILAGKAAQTQTASSLLSKLQGLVTANPLCIFTPEGTLSRIRRLHLLPRTLVEPSNDLSAAPSSDSVVLLTSDYPFGSGEEFLENEIAHLANEFARVIIAPLSYRPGRQVTRALPANATLALLDSRYRSGNDLSDLLYFVSRKPLRLFKALGSAARHATGLRQLLENTRFELHTSILSLALESAAARLRLDKNSTVFYSYWFHSQARVALMLREAIKLPTAPVISRAHRGDLYFEESPSGFLPMRTLMASELAGVYPVSSHGQQYLEHTFPSQSNKFQVHHLGVTPAKNPKNGSVCVQHLVSCSNFKPVKRLDLLVESIAEAQRNLPDLKWTHIGAGSADQQETVQALAHRLLRPGSYSFIGALPNPRLRTWYDENSVSGFINVSSSEGVPVTIMEALAQGFPVIATDVGGTSEALAGQGMFQGLVDASATPEQIAERIVALCGAPETAYKAWADKSFAHWTAEWSSERNYTQFAKGLRSLSKNG